MRIQNNLKIFFEVVLCKKVYVIFVLVFCMPMYVHAVYEDCEAVGSAYIENNLCKIEVKNCKEDGVTLQVPEGYKITASCNIKHGVDVCPTVVPRPEWCDLPRCPTDPNECANDDESDGIANYTNTTAVGTPSQNANEIHSCEKVGETTIENYKCRMRVTSCKRGNEDIIPPGDTGTAVCDLGDNGACTKSNPPTCSCPTDPNECANDNEGDSVANYSGTEPITSNREQPIPMPRITPPYLEGSDDSSGGGVR